jgi:DNA-binding NarL/FixJ family response regulator
VGVVEGMQKDYGVHLMPMALSFTDYEGCLAAARSQLDEEAWSAAWEQGKAMPLEQVVEYALSEEEEEEHEEAPAFVAMPEQHPPTYERTQRLTAREQEVTFLVGRGLINRQIAQELSISERTVENHIGKILK